MRINENKIFDNIKEKNFITGKLLPVLLTFANSFLKEKKFF